LSRITWNDVLDKDTLIVLEIKTKKLREIKLGRTLRERIEIVYNELKTPNTNDLLFHYTLQHTNLLLKQGGVMKGLQIRIFQPIHFLKVVVDLSRRIMVMQMNI